ncbi:MAG: hypothetical protein QXY62_05895 [Candidatus Altiarchaeota archaeon]
MKEESSIEYVTQLLEKIEKGLGEIYDFKQALKETIENVDSRMSVIEAKVEEIKKNSDAKTSEKIKTMETEIEKTQNAVEDIGKLIKENNKFLEATYIEVKNIETDIKEKFKEVWTEINNIKKNSEKQNKLLKVFKELLKIISE